MTNFECRKLPSLLSAAILIPVGLATWEDAIDRTDGNKGRCYRGPTLISIKLATGRDVELTTYCADTKLPSMSAAILIPIDLAIENNVDDYMVNRRKRGTELICVYR